MSEKKVGISLDKEMTWAGKNYGLGLNEMPEAAAKSAVRRKFGTMADGSTPVADVPENFKPLSFEETMKRFEENDNSSEVFDSLKFYQPRIAASKAAGMSLEEYLEKENADGGNEKTADKNKSSDKTDDGLALDKDLPMRHVFAALGEKYDSDEKIKALSRADLIAVNGIAATTADKILAYFAEKK